MNRALFSQHTLLFFALKAQPYSVYGMKISIQGTFKRALE